MSNFIIKICGITTQKDAILSKQAGASWLGIIFVPQSPRCTSINVAKPIVHQAKLAGVQSVVGVFQNQSLAEITTVINQVGVDRVQLHGDEMPEFCTQVSVPVIKTITLSSTVSTTALYKTMETYLALPNVEYCLLDLPKTDTSDSVSIFNMLQGSEPLDLSQYPILLAGGLTPKNVSNLIHYYQPTGVDVASGVESSIGQKDPAKTHQFCHAARQAAEHLFKKGMPSCNR